MNPQDLLADLRPNHAPDPIGWWPPAPGWWLLLIISVVVAAVAVWLRSPRRRARQWKKIAKASFNEQSRRYQQQPNNAELKQLIVLLKRIIATGTRDQTVMSLTGEQWRSCLQQHFSLDEAALHTLTQGHYQTNPPTLNDQALIALRKGIGELGNV